MYRYDLGHKIGHYDLETKTRKPRVDALGEFTFWYDTTGFDWLAKIEETFGLLVKESNIVVKFKFILVAKKLEEDNPEVNFQVKIIYLSENPIDCEIDVNPDRDFTKKIEKFRRNLTVGEEIFNSSFKHSVSSIGEFFLFDVKVRICLKKQSSFLNRVAKSFNDILSSDFTVLCQDKEFHVHQYILKQQSKYFDRLLQNDCLESNNKKIVIEDFEPEVVEIVLRYMYNGAICWYDTAKNFERFEGVVKIADKYNLSELLDSLDSQFAQWNHHHLLLLMNLIELESDRLKYVQRVIKLIDTVPLPKTALLFFKWRSEWLIVNIDMINDTQWAQIILENSDFAKLCMNVAGRKDYQSWAEQHKKWVMDFGLGVDEYDYVSMEEHHSCLIVEPLEDIDGAIVCSPTYGVVECSPIWPRKV